MSRSSRRQYGEGSIYEYEARGVRRFRVQWLEPSDPDEPGGKALRRSKAGFATKRDAAVFLRDALRSVDRGERTRLDGDQPTLGQHMTEWLEGLRLEGTTIDGYRRLVRLHVLPYPLADVALTKLRPANLARHYRRLEVAGRREHGVEGGPLGPNTVRKVHDVLSSALTSAQADGLIDSNPAKHPGAKPPTGAEVKRAKPEMVIWTPAQLERFLEWAYEATPDLYVCWLLIGSTGLRRGEALGARWKDVSFETGRLHVRRALVTRKRDGEKERLEEKLTKSNHDRTVDLEPHVVDALKERRAAVAGVVPENAGPEARIVTKRDGGPMRPDQLTRRWESAVSRFNADPLTRQLPKMGMHGLRHTFASHMLAAGVPVPTVSEMLGHDSHVLLSVYAHTLPSAQRDALEKLAAFRRRPDVAVVAPSTGHPHGQV